MKYRYGFCFSYIKARPNRTRKENVNVNIRNYRKPLKNSVRPEGWFTDYVITQQPGIGPKISRAHQTVLRKPFAVLFRIAACEKFVLNYYYAVFAFEWKVQKKKIYLLKDTISPQPFDETVYCYSDLIIVM